MENYTALLIGATGATGKALVNQLLDDPQVSQLHIFVRKAIEQENPKLQQHLVDFDQLDNWKHLLKGDVLFSALGTTLKQAGSQAAQYKIDVSYQLEVAKAAADNGVPKYVLVSAYGANPNSRIFYSRMKGELEEAVKGLAFQQVHIFQPGMLDRGPADSRAVETYGIKVLNLLNSLSILKSQRPLPVAVLAEKMRKVVGLAASPKVQVHVLDKIFSL